MRVNIDSLFIGLNLSKLSFERCTVPVPSYLSFNFCTPNAANVSRDHCSCGIRLSQCKHVILIPDMQSQIVTGSEQALLAVRYGVQVPLLG